MNREFFIPSSFNSKYAYASGRVRALETKLLDQQKITKLVVTENIEHFFGELSDSPYKNYIEKLEKSLSFEDLLFEVYNDLIDELTKLSYEKKIAQFFDLYFDTYNIKMILKHLYYKKPYREKLFPYGNIGKEIFKDDSIIMERIPNIYLPIFEKYEEDIKENKNGELVINEVVDKYYYEEISREAREIRSEYLIFLNTHNIELINCYTLLRSKVFGFPHIILLRDGFTDIKELTRLKDQNFDEIMKYFIHSGYEKLLDTRIKEPLELLKNFTIKKNQYINGIYDYSKYITMGIEVLIIYFYEKREELNILRKIFLSKLRNLSSKEIMELL